MAGLRIFLNKPVGLLFVLYSGATGVLSSASIDIAVVVFAPIYILSIFFVSSWASENVMRTITNNTTTRFLSVKIFFIYKGN